MTCDNYAKSQFQPVFIYSGCCSKIPQNRWLVSRNVLLIVPEAKIQDQGASTVGWRPSFRSQTSCVITWSKALRRLFSKSLIPFIRFYLQDVSISPSPHLISPLGIRVSTYEYSIYEHPDHYYTMSLVSCIGTQLHLFVRYCVWLLSQATTAELSSCDRDYVANKAVYNVAFYRKSLTRVS